MNPGFGDLPIPAKAGYGPNSWGFINRNGTTLIPFQFEHATLFSNGLAAVKNADGWGFIDMTGKWIIPPRFAEARPFAKNGLAAVRRGEVWGFVSKAGNEVVPCQFTAVSGFANDRACVSKGTVSGGFAKGGWGVIDENGNEIVGCKYFNILPFHSGYAIVWDKQFVFDDKDTGTWGIIDRSGKFTLALQSNTIFHCCSWGDGLDEDELESPHATVLFGMSHKTRSMFEMRLVTAHGDAFTKVRCEMRMGLKRGDSLIPVVNPNDLDTLIRTGVSDDSWSKYGFLGADGNLAIPHRFTSAEPFSEGNAAVSLGAAKEEKWGFIDERGRFSIEPQFTKTQRFSEGIAAVKIGELWGYIDKQGNWLTQPQFEEATPFSGGIAFVKAPKKSLTTQQQQQPSSPSTPHETKSGTAAPVTSDDITPIMTIAKFPGDFVGMTFKRKLWLCAEDITKKGNSDNWLMIARDGSVKKDSAPQVGNFFFDSSDLNLLLTPDQAKQVSQLEAGFFHKCDVIFKVEKRSIGGKVYFVTAIKEIIP